jgi:hypothetical protein
MMACDPADTATYYRTRPRLIVEVLSDSTERIDRRANGWRAESLTASELRFESHDIVIPLTAIYEDVPLP